MQTNLERGLRAVTTEQQTLNRTDLAAPLSISVPTVDHWLHIPEITGQVMLVPPYFEDFGKRILACYLGFNNGDKLERSRWAATGWPALRFP